MEEDTIQAMRAKLDAAQAAREAVLLRHMAAGVLIDSRDIYIDETVQIAPGARILPGTILRGNTVIGAGCVIGPNTLIEDSVIGAGTTVNASQIYASQIGPHNAIGPFTHVRVGTVTDYGVHLGAYVETKNSNFARGNTVSHLTYIGDYCFIGCNTNLVAPVKVGNGAYTAAGSTITNDVPDGALAIARDRQTNLDDWAVPKMEPYIEKKKALEETQRAEEANRQN